MSESDEELKAKLHAMWTKPMLEEAWQNGLRELLTRQGVPSEQVNELMESVRPKVEARLAAEFPHLFGPQSKQKENL
jgi:hypothetical protein